MDSWNRFEILESHFHDYEFPKISIVIPTCNCSQSVSTTIESVLSQDYPNFEVIVIDADSNDRTVEVIKRFRDDRISLFNVSEYQRYEMMNKGIIQASGEYINFLFPGDFYLSRFALKWMMNLALDKKKPDLVYCGSLLRDGRTEVKILNRNFSLAILKKGQQPTSLQSCWFKNDALISIGKFNGDYLLRGGFDLFCRFSLNSNLHIASTTRILTDYDLRWVSKRMVIRHFWETMKTLYRNFGLIALIRWFFVQKDISRFLKLWMRSAKIAFTGR